MHVFTLRLSDEPRVLKSTLGTGARAHCQGGRPSRTWAATGKMANPIEYISRHRVAFRQLDVNGHMTTSAYLEACLDHRFCALREVGLDLAALARLPHLLVVRSVELELRASLYADQEYEIRSWVKGFDETDCEVLCELSSRKRAVALCKLEIACVCREKRRAARWDPALMARFYAPETSSSTS